MNAVSFWAWDLVPAIISVAGLVIVLVCRPLIDGKVGPNPFYGIRTPLAFSSEENWYRLNRLGGQILSRAGWLTLFVGLAGFVLSPLLGLIVYNLIAAVLVLGALIFAATRILLLR